MMVKKAVAGILTAGVLTLGGTGMAYAATAPQGTPNQGSAVQHRDGDRCQRAEGRLDALNKRRVHLEARIDKLQKLIAKAHEHHREDLAQKLEKRADHLQKVKDKVVDRIQRIHERCDGTAAATTSAQ